MTEQHNFYNFRNIYPVATKNAQFYHPYEESLSIKSLHYLNLLGLLPIENATGSNIKQIIIIKQKTNLNKIFNNINKIVFVQADSIQIHICPEFERQAVSELKKACVVTIIIF